MNIVAIMGSPLGMKGNTGKLLGAVLAGCKEAGAKVKILELGKLKIGPCKGCAACHKTGQCVIKDDYAKVKRAMVAADGIIFASPNYISSVTAQMKALFDRCTCVLHCQAFEGKYAQAVVTSGGPESGEVEQYILRFARALGCWTVGSIGAEAWQLAEEKLAKPGFAKAAGMGKHLAAVIRDKETYPEQLQARSYFYERMKMLVKMHKEDWPYEYKYWRKMGRIQ